MKKTQELYHIIRKDDETGARLYIASVRDIYTGMAGTLNISARSKSATIDFLRRHGIRCPHRAYRN